MYLTAKAAGEKKNHCCRYSVRETSALIGALVRGVFGVHSACFLFLAQAFVTSAFFVWGKQVLTVPSYLNVWSKHITAQNATGSCWLTEVCCFVWVLLFFLLFFHDSFLALTRSDEKCELY